MSAPLRAGHIVPYPASYAGRPTEEPTIASRFPVPFQAPAFASWAPCPTGEFRFLYSRPTRTRDAPWTPAGVYTFRTRETRPGWVPSVSRGRGVPPSRAASPAGHVRFSAASPAPRQSFHLRGSKSRDISQGFNRSPVRPSSSPWPPGGARTLRLSPELSTLPLPATHLGAKTGHTDTDPGLYHRHNRTSFAQPTQLVRPRVAMLPFGHRRSLLGPSCARWGTGPSSRSAYRRASRRTPSGLSCSACDRCGRGGCPLNPGDGGALPAGQVRPAGTRRLPAAGPCSPAFCLPPAEVLMTRRHRGFTCVHPSGLPQPVVPRVEREPLGLSPGFAPCSYPQRTPGRGRSLRTGPGATSPTSADLPSTSATLRMRPHVAPPG
jgi:hypothetical protein